MCRMQALSSNKIRDFVSTNSRDFSVLQSVHTGSVTENKRLIFKSNIGASLGDRVAGK